MFTVYKITNKINDKCYIGSSIRVEKRWKQHINDAQNPNSNRYQYPLYQAFRKYGIENFNFEILRDDFNDEKEMTAFEKEMIIFFNSCGDKGYNQTLETTNYGIASENLQKHLTKVKQKCAKVDKDENILEIYESYHDAARKNGLDGDDRASTIRDVCKGMESSCLGNIYRDLDDRDQVISKPMKPYKGRTPVIAIQIDDPAITLFFESVSEAAIQLNTDRGSIHKCIAGDKRYSVVKGYIIRKLDYHGNIVLNGIDIEERIQEYNDANPMINGIRHTISEWCEIYGITRQTIYRRKNKGMDVVEAITTPKGRR